MFKYECDYCDITAVNSVVFRVPNVDVTVICSDVIQEKNKVISFLIHNVQGSVWLGVGVGGEGGGGGCAVGICYLGLKHCGLLKWELLNW